MWLTTKAGMKSGSLRAKPGAAERQHRLRHVELDDDAPADVLRCAPAAAR